MPEATADGIGQVPPASQPPDGNGQVPPTSQVSTDSEHDDSSADELTPAQYRALVEKLRKENAQRRVDSKRLAELETWKRQADEASLSETEKLQRRYADDQTTWAEKEAAYQQRLIRADIRSAAKDLGIKSELAYRLIDQSAIEFNEDGDPTNVVELLTAAMADFGLSPAVQQQPQQPQSQPAPAAPAMGATNPPRGSQVAGANGTFSRGEIPKLTDPRLWKR